MCPAGGTAKEGKVEKGWKKCLTNRKEWNVARINKAYTRRLGLGSYLPTPLIPDIAEPARILADEEIPDILDRDYRCMKRNVRIFRRRKTG